MVPQMEEARGIELELFLRAEEVLKPRNDGSSDRIGIAGALIVGDALQLGQAYIFFRFRGQDLTHL